MPDGRRYEIEPTDWGTWRLKLFDDDGEEAGGGQFDDFTEAQEEGDRWVGKGDA